MKEILQTNISKYVQLSAKELDDFFELMTFKQFAPDDYLLRDGQICSHRFFILEGLVRTFYIDRKGVEKITQFGIEQWWITDLESFIQNSPSNFYIQAIETTQCLCISKQHLEKLYRENPKIERLFRVLTENHLLALQKKYTHYWHLSNKEKYQAFVHSLPGFSQRIPQYMIASYLEMTPEYLSDIRKKK